MSKRGSSGTRNFDERVKSGQVDGCGASEMADGDERSVRRRLEAGYSRCCLSRVPRPLSPHVATTDNCAAAVCADVRASTDDNASATTNDCAAAGCAG